MAMLNKRFVFFLLIGLSIVASMVGNHTDGTIFFAAAMIIGTR